MKLWHRNKKDNLSEFQGVPQGTFRCDVCKFIQPLIGLCGAIVDARDSPPVVYSMCGCCALWLGLGTSRFPKGQLINFSDKQRNKIKALHREIDNIGGFDRISKQVSELAEERLTELQIDNSPAESFEKIHEILEVNPNFRSLIKFRSFTSSDSFRELSDRLTRGEFVDAREIKKANRGISK